VWGIPMEATRRCWAVVECRSLKLLVNAIDTTSALEAPEARLLDGPCGPVDASRR